VDADWSPTIGSFEHHDSARTSYFPEFEAFSAPRSEASVQYLSDLSGLWNAAFSSNERGFALHGVLGGVGAAGPPSVTMFNPGTMEPLKRVTLTEPTADDWVYPGGVAVQDRHLPYAGWLHALPLANPLSAATTASGASSGARCPHEGTTSSVAFGASAANGRMCSTG
jgi:hypothetical protein